MNANIRACHGQASVYLSKYGVEHVLVAVEVQSAWELRQANVLQHPLLKHLQLSGNQLLRRVPGGGGAGPSSLVQSVTDRSTEAYLHGARMSCSSSAVKRAVYTHRQ